MNTLLFIVPALWFKSTGYVRADEGSVCIQTPAPENCV